MKNKNLLYGIVVVIIIGLIGVVYFSPNKSSDDTQIPETTMAQPGEHCGGNIMNALSCTAGYHCAAEPGSHLPFGDVGGICVQD